VTTELPAALHQTHAYPCQRSYCDCCQTPKLSPMPVENLGTCCILSAMHKPCHAMPYTHKSVCTGAGATVQHFNVPLPSIWRPTPDSQTSQQTQQGTTWEVMPGALCGGRTTWRKQETFTPYVWSRGSVKSSSAALLNGTRCQPSACPCQMKGTMLFA